MRAGLLAEECVVRKPLSEALADEELGVDIGLAHDVLRALARHVKRLDIGEVGRRERARLGDELGREGEPLIDPGLGDLGQLRTRHALNLAGCGILSPKPGRPANPARIAVHRLHDRGVEDG